MKEGIREKVKERAYGFAVGASMPAVLLAPIGVGLAVTGNPEAAKGIGEISAIAMAGSGLWGTVEFKNALSVKRHRKALKVTPRLGLKEKFLDQPKPLKSVKSYIRQLYEEWEIEALKGYDPTSAGEGIDAEKVFLEGFTPDVISGYIANHALNKLKGLMKDDGRLSLYDKSSEERERYIKESDALVELLKFGWRSKLWHEKGGIIQPSNVDPYSEVAIGVAFMTGVTWDFPVKSSKELSGLLSVLAVPSHLRK